MSQKKVTYVKNKLLRSEYCKKADGMRHKERNPVALKAGLEVLEYGFAGNGIKSIGRSTE